MAERLFVVDLNLNGNEAKNFRVEDYTTDPTSGNFQGRLIHNTTTTPPGTKQRLKMYDGTDFNAFAYTTELTSGTVTSVGLSAPGIFTVSNNPVTTSGTLTLSLATQTANYVWAGPTTGSPAAPSFRALVAGDIPTLTASKLSDFNEAAQDAAASMITNATHTNISVSYNDEEGKLAFTAGATYSDENARDAAASLITGSSHSGISVSYTDDGGNAGTLAFTNTGVTGITGTANEIEVSASTGSVTIGLPNNVTIAGDLKVNGDLDIVGNINSFSTTTIKVEDNLFLLNSTVTGTPSSVPAGIEVERGTYTNASILWNETSNLWTVSSPKDTSDAATEHSIARKYVTTTTGTTHTITHNLATLDVTVNCWLAGSQVEAGIVVTDSNTVTVTTNSSITDLKTVVVG